MINELTRLLCDAAGIIRRQAALLMMHGIDTEDGKLESDEFDILAEIREAVGTDGNRCDTCGKTIPEGRQVCPICEAKGGPTWRNGKSPKTGACKG